MKLYHYFLYCLCILLLVACTEVEEGQQTVRQPDYLAVYTIYKDTALQKTCENYKEKVDKIPHKRYGNVYPGNLEDDMEIDKTITTENGWDFVVSCDIEATYYVSSNTILKETYNYPLQNMLSYNKETKEWSLK